MKCCRFLYKGIHYKMILHPVAFTLNIHREKQSRAVLMSQLLDYVLAKNILKPYTIDGSDVKETISVPDQKSNVQYLVPKYNMVIRKDKKLTTTVDNGHVSPCFLRFDILDQISVLLMVLTFVHWFMNGFNVCFLPSQLTPHTHISIKLC